jgi:hypothetical protein
MVNRDADPTVRAQASLAVPPKNPTTVRDFVLRRFARMLLYLLAIPTVPPRLFGPRPACPVAAAAQSGLDRDRRRI